VIWSLLAGAALAGDANVGGYFRIPARPDLQGGSGRLGYWNLYGRLMNEGAYGMLELRYDLIDRDPQSLRPWSAVYVRLEGGSIANADPLNGSMTAYRISQMYVRSGNVLLKDVTWQVGTQEFFFGDLGLYDFRPSTLMFRTVGVSGRYDRGPFELLVGGGDNGFGVYGTRYSPIPTAAAAARLRLVPGHLELGGGFEGRFEPAVTGSLNAPYQTPRIDYEDWIRGEVGERFVAENGEQQAPFFPDPVARDATSWAAIGMLGFGQAGPIVWNNLFVRYERLHPEKTSQDSLLGAPLTLHVHDFTDQRTVFTAGDELQLRLVKKRLDAVVGGYFGDHRDRDNDIAPSDHDRTYWSQVTRLQAYVSPTVHLLVENAVAEEWSRNGNAYREHADSIFANTDGRPDVRGLERGDSDTRFTWQGKGGVVLNPLGPGIFVRPSLRFLYGVQYSSQNNAFGNAFVETVDQENAFGNVERHYHHLLSIETETWF
jgi:hypothetical protein